MSTHQSTADYIVDQLSGAGDVYARKMFGEYALYCDGRVVGLITDDSLYIKITEAGKAFLGKNYQEGNAYVGAKPSMVISEDMIADRSWLVELVQLTARHLPLPKKRK